MISPMTGPCHRHPQHPYLTLVKKPMIDDLMMQITTQSHCQNTPATGHGMPSPDIGEKTNDPWGRGKSQAYRVDNQA